MPGFWKMYPPLFALALGLASAVFPASAAETYAGTGQILHVNLYDGHSGILIKTSQTMVDPEGCGRTDWYIIPDTLAHYDKVYALLLTAQSSRQQVHIILNGCVQGLPAVRHIRMLQN